MQIVNGGPDQFGYDESMDRYTEVEKYGKKIPRGKFVIAKYRFFTHREGRIRSDSNKVAEANSPSSGKFT